MPPQEENGMPSPYDVAISIRADRPTGALSAAVELVRL